MSPGKVAPMVCLLVLLGGRARAKSEPAPLPVDEIVRRTVEVMEQKPAQLVCRVVSDRRILDGGGKVDDHEQSEIQQTR